MCEIIRAVQTTQEKKLQKFKKNYIKLIWKLIQKLELHYILDYISCMQWRICA